ncbi:TIGR03013 family PEP-CTERM/XrtA system glycosyltransferase [Caldimonas thermodepolymerans]|uniref:Sugar transferase (PEP-CTERM system associated)/exopolysaccharide biosynthesis polyprenyl glycosylphosphotransferase n=1 Tax=Caldimonas thermodepolymerans TaxID=215580 RepID=A0AA46DHF6_9BURK|nr:TIGR03013 family XrtA/PEP-CTERM system glycosyltransferase [Caldimonas thermodepolymerans]QPC32924.1 TIGR03013 family PEP-CTERM/XrtA system glycosyltransferase [Caldimonas thermodepolymerans]RDI03704.1 sugar transferase (PEP-CTERM system associated)/exopolysaccharide biosynthesis polyprenyl glycosylphosphotransferase [Caldimonas thermodepolymerans]TCP09673.1 sugar transferase (PEP-CTERM system associated)/exopolysaccharide biosynthesis polyprenyl glycosylphosphotransferase [Caldimonas thermod
MKVFRLFHHHVALSTLLELFADSLLCFLAALFIASALHMVPNGGDALAQSGMVWLAGGFAAVMLLLYASVGLYRRGTRSMGLGTLIQRAMLAIALGACITYLLFDSVAGEASPGYVVGLAMVYLLVGLVVVRAVIYMVQKAVGVPRVLIIGTGEDAQAVARDLATHSRIERQVVGFYPTTERTEGMRPDQRVFSRDRSIEEIVAEHDIDEIIVAVREQRGGALPMDQLLACRIAGTPILDLAGFYERARAEVPIDSLKASWLIYSQGFVQGPARRFAKRAFDIVTSATLLLLTSPIMLLTAIAIRLDSPGPIIYRQERVGLGGRTFMCLKFRSMTVDAEKDGVARWASQNDSRVTRVGAFIRKTRIDELPQLLSVLKGEMSMVGPRPERPSFVQQLREQIPFYDLRHSVKPGVTGWAQVRYSYGASVEDARRKHQYDLYYVKNNSLFLDILVLIETVSVVLFREGSR